MTQKIVPNIWCNHNAEEVAAFYASVLPGTTAIGGARYPDDVPDWQGSFAGETLTMDVVVQGYIMTLINAGDEFRPNPAISFILNFDPLAFGDEVSARAALDDVWNALAEGGQELMPLGEYPFSPRYGWVQDRFGVSWQLMLTDPDGEPRPFLIPSLTFGGAAQNRAREAVDFYSSLFGGPGPSFVAEYPAPSGPAAAGAVMFCDFPLAGQWFAAMDSGMDQDFSFTPGISLEVRCADQTEIDRFWEALSAVPEAEQCGWLVDRFGVSWQIVPENMGELMDRPGAYQRMLDMKKLVIAEF